MSKGRPSKDFNKQQIENAINETQSFFEAARYLNVNYLTFKKYAMVYGLWIVGGKNPSTRGIHKVRRGKYRNINIILEGGRNGKKLNLTRLRDWIIRELKLPQRCDQCHLDEQRVTDYKTPLILVFKDGDRTNYKLENLRLLCYNCVFFTEGNISGRKKGYFSNGISGDVYEQIE